MQRFGESIFSGLYLLFDLIAAIIFFLHSNSTVLLMFGLLTIVLGAGDAFHLVPRIIGTFDPTIKGLEWWTGFGLLISSTTMTIFYVILYYIWLEIFSALSYPVFIGPLILICAGIRIVLCLFPQNNWFHYEGNQKWGIYRNIPFVIVGGCVAYLYLLSGNTYALNLWQIGIAIIISFACYLPVVLWSKKNPKIGLLMIPKTLAYIWMISVGLSLIGSF